MNIQGVEILTQKTIYSPQWFGIATWIIFLIATICLLGLWADGFLNKGAGIASCFTAVLFLLCLILTMAQSSNILNYPTKIKYEIEITDDNAWKELGPNYIVEEKIYNNKEIYLVEGDYVE